jgi:hypothetical protein
VKNRLDSAIPGEQDDHSEPSLGNVLLVLEILVHGDQNLKPCLGPSPQKLAVLNARPAHLHYGLHLVAAELVCELTRH